ncbi:phage major capsid protein [Clostridium botulinum]|uniref:phage major capsid protein n=1 Tax=Clostridium botulinum TaxID=1491 RepID=UPI0007747A5B|nr:phage major capsid protein [Clostridium botulinum]NFE93708.1 phage major capsid protein [Clostridium botulinum]NFL38458.1 phage major capsid protein [Clostridium botulinum]NFL65898.1 phage major capsid protein [Clostridium botulinum]NFN08295.1 phage major capsid protein [Clostridium botulinum]NFN24392.1 phage major capsid protein [Clostridium botulinum]
MNKELRELLEQINNKKEEVKNLANENKIIEAKAAKEELIKLQDKFNIMYDLEDEAKDSIENKMENGDAKIANKNKKTVLNSFVNAVKAGLRKQPVAEEDLQVLNSMKEGTDADGGLTVPKDIQTKVKELRRSQDSLEALVNVEKVTTNSGSRVIEKKADQTPFDNVDEEAEFPDVSTPQFENIEYKVKKKGGILKVAIELLSDTAENILGYLTKWITKKSRATRNFMIVAKINEITKGLEKTITGIDDLKDIFNVELDPSIALTSSVVTNQNGFNWLDKLKDSDGKYILQSNPTQATQKLLFGKYPVVVLSNKVFASTKEGDKEKYPIVCGDLKEAITIFDRELMTIEMSSEAGDLWLKDQKGIKVRERLDIKAVDKEAIVKAEVSATA